MDKKRRQHYVWRHYLKPWTFGEQIWCLRENRTFTNGLMGIGNSSYFYKINELTEKDIDLIQKLWVNDAPPILKELYKNWIILFSAIHTVKRISEKNGAYEKMKEGLDLAIINFEEDMHAHIEGGAIPYIEKLINNDVGFLKDENGYFEFIYFLCVQYFRTKKRKETFLELQEEFKSFDLVKIWNVCSHIMATALAFGMIREKEDFTCVMLKNNSTTEFITGDQPVINTFAKLDEKEKLEHEELELYYPITPKSALIISRKPEYKGIEEVEVDEVFATQLNDMIFLNSYDQIYSNNELSLLKYKK
jgi:hypothetical protein